MAVDLLYVCGSRSSHYNIVYSARRVFESVQPSIIQAVLSSKFLELVILLSVAHTAQITKSALWPKNQQLRSVVCLCVLCARIYVSGIYE